MSGLQSLRKFPIANMDRTRLRTHAICLFDSIIIENEISYDYVIKFQHNFERDKMYLKNGYWLHLI